MKSERFAARLRYVFVCTFVLLITAVVTPTHAGDTAIPVSVSRDGDRYILLRDGKPFEVRAISGFDQLDVAAAAGVNTIRTWSGKHLDDGNLLDEAHRHGMGVVVGLWMGHKRDGFDYADPVMVAKQREGLKQEILKYKDHPAVLIWAVGNEAEARGGQPYEAINEVAAFIKEVDPNHPTMTVLAGSSVERITAVRERAPLIDILGMNTYGSYANVPKNVRKAGWTGPYMVTEIGINGTWEHSNRTDWGVPTEPPSGIKADIYRERYTYLLADRNQCLGVFPFKWGYVPKGTSSWFSLFHANGEPNAVVDTMHHIWTGQWPDDRAPRVMSLNINGQAYDSNIRLQPGERATAVIAYDQADPQTLNVRWEVLPEQKIFAAQGSQPITDAVRDADIEQIDAHTIRFTAPREPGPYRLYFYGYTPTRKIGTANAPFLVEER